MPLMPNLKGSTLVFLFDVCAIVGSSESFRLQLKFAI